MRIITAESAVDQIAGVLFLFLCHTSFGLEVTAPSTQVALFHSQAILPCTFRIEAGLINPQFLAVIWYFGAKELLRFDNKEKVVSKGMSFDEREAKRGNASLTILNTAIADQGTYKCLVIYSPDRQQREIRLNVHANPEVRLQRKAVRKDETNQLYCSILGFFPREVTVTWLRNNIPIRDKSEMGKFQMDADDTFRVNSSVFLTPAQIKDRPSIACQVEHVSLQGPIQDAYTVQYGVAPKVGLTSSRTEDHNELIYVCEASGFSPEPLSINWLVDGKMADLSRRSEDGVFNKEIYYQINLKDDHIPKQISCSVQHETLISPVIETLEVDQHNECTRHCHSGLTAAIALLLIMALLFTGISGYLIKKKKYLTRFQVSHIHQQWTWTWTNEEMLNLYCVAHKCPKMAQVTWTITVEGRDPITVSDYQQYKDEEMGPLLHSDYSMKTDRTESNGLHNVTSVLSFNPATSEYKKTEVKCNFLCGGKSKERSLMCTFETKKPVMKDSIKMFRGESKNIVCSATLENFYPRDIHIQWSYGGDQYEDMITTEENVTPNAKDHTYTAISKCTIPSKSLERLSDVTKVRVTWSHQSVNQPESRERTLTEIPLRPVMKNIAIPLLLHSREAKLQCEIRGFFPNNLEVKWLRREAGKPELYEVSSSDKYKIPLIESTQQSDKTYTCTASIIVHMSAVTDQGSEFICRVTHPSLETHLEEKTGELNVQGIPTVTLKQESDAGKILTAQISNFYPQKIKVTWSQSKGKSEQKFQPCNQKEYSVSEPRLQSDGTFFTCDSWVSSKILSIVTNIMHLDDNKLYKITVGHESVKSPIEKIFKHIKGGPFVEVTKEQSGGETTQAAKSSSKVGNREKGIPTVTLKQELDAGKTLTAQISNFYPEKINVTWSHSKGKSEEQFKPYKQNKDYSVSEPSPQSDGTFTCDSSVPSKKLKDNILYKITVVYESVKSPIEKIYKRTKGGPFVDVTKESSGEQTARAEMSDCKVGNKAEGGSFVEETKEQSGEETSQAEMSGCKVGIQEEGGPFVQVTKDHSCEETSQAETSGCKVGIQAEATGGQSKGVTKEQSGEENTQDKTSGCKVVNQAEGGPFVEVTKEQSGEETSQAEMSSCEGGNQAEGEEMLKLQDRKDSTKKKQQNSLRRLFNK